MTTIVYAAGVIAADSMLSDDSVKHRINKLAEIHKHKAVVACAGDFFAGTRFVEWFRDRRRKPPDPTSDMEALVVYRNGDLELWNADLSRTLLNPDYPFAIGSGAQAALGALHAGADAIRACEIACEIDPGSCGPVHWIRVMQPPEPPT